LEKIAATVFLVCLAIIDCIVSPFLCFSPRYEKLAWAVVPNFKADLNHIWSAHANTGTAGPSQIAKEEAPKLSQDENREHTSPTIEGLDLATPKKPSLAEPKNRPIAAHLDLEVQNSVLSKISSLSESEQKELIDCLKNAKMPSSKQHRALLIDIAENYKTLKKLLPTLPKSQQEFIQECFASPMQLFQIPKLIHSPYDSQVQQCPGLAGAKKFLHHEKGDRLREMQKQLRGENPKIHPALQKDIDRPLGPVFQVKDSQDIEISNPYLDSFHEKAAQKLINPDYESPARSAKEETARKELALTTLFTNLKTFSSLKEVEKIPLLIQAFVSQYVSGDLAARYMCLSMIPTQQKMRASSKKSEGAPDHDTVAIRIQDKSPTEIVFEYEGTAYLKKMPTAETPEVFLGTLHYKIPFTLVKEGDQWIDQSVDYDHDQRFQFKDEPFLFEPMSY